MYTLIVREFVSGVLVPLPQLVARLGLVNVVSWRFRHVKFHYGRPFGYAVQDFELMTRDTPGGFRVPSDSFRDFLNAEFQIIDGEIDALAADDVCLLTLNCVDGSQWELTTAFDELAADLERRGFRHESR
jgi:hypothetical protein